MLKLMQVNVIMRLTEGEVVRPCGKITMLVDDQVVVVHAVELLHATESQQTRYRCTF